MSNIFGNGSAFTAGNLSAGSGSAAAPSINFRTDVDTGAYNESDGKYNIAANGVEQLEVNTTSIVSNVPFYAPNGSAAAPSYTFANDTDSGLYYTGTANTIALSTAGTQRVTVNTASLTSTLPILAPNGTLSNPGISFAFSPSTGLFSPGAGLYITSGGVLQAQITSSLFSIVPQLVKTTVNNVSTPEYSFSGDTDTGIFYSGAADSGSFGLCSQGTSKLLVTPTVITTTQPFRAANGSASAPSYSFTNSTGSGLYYTGTANTIALTTNGTARLTMNTTAVTMDSIPLTVSQTGATTALNVSNATGGAQTPAPLSVTNSSSTSGARTAYFLTANTANDSGQAGNLGFGKADSSRQMAFLLFYPSASAGSEKIGFNIHSFGNVAEFNGAGQTLGYNTSMAATAPTYSFQGDTNTGIYASAADTINFATGGTNRFQMDSTTFKPVSDNVQSCGASGARWTAVWAANGTIQTSDQNQKQNIQACSLGLNFIEKLNPVSYVWRPTPITERVLNEETGEYEEKKTEKIHTRKQYGLIAQEVKTVMDELKIVTNDAGFYIDTSVNEPDKPTSYGLNYTQFIAPLIKAVQELSAKVKVLEMRLDAL